MAPLSRQEVLPSDLVDAMPMGPHPEGCALDSWSLHLPLVLLPNPH